MRGPGAGAAVIAVPADATVWSRGCLPIQVPPFGRSGFAPGRPPLWRQASANPARTSTSAVRASVVRSGGTVTSAGTRSSTTGTRGQRAICGRQRRANGAGRLTGEIRPKRLERDAREATDLHRGKPAGAYLHVDEPR